MSKHDCPGSDGSTGQGSPLHLPGFIREPCVLDLRIHAEAGLSPGLGYYGFSLTTSQVPITLEEFMPMARHYPIVFSEENWITPIAMLGCPGALNQFLESNGSWRAGFQIPAWIRLYPFLPIIDGRGRVRLGVDTACRRFLPSVPSGHCERLFDGQGEPTRIAVRALRMCELLVEKMKATREWGNALLEDHQLVVRADQAGDRSFGKRRLHGVHLIDPAAHRGLPIRRLVTWHRNGWTIPAALHLASQHNWQWLRRKNASMNHPGSTNAMEEGAG